MAVSLATYDLDFRWKGRLVPGFAIGSVHTRADFRGKGLAPGLLEWVERYQAQRGAVLSILFSDIDPGYYARLGYQLCPSWEGWLTRDELQARPDPRENRLQPVDPLLELEKLARMYAECQACRPLSIQRSHDYWEYTLRKSTDDAFFWLLGSDSEPAGYFRLETREQQLVLSDWAVRAGQTELWQPLVDQFLAEAKRRQVEQAGGWLPHLLAARRAFALQARPMEITMVKSLSPESLCETDLQGFDWCCEIDHV